MTASLIAEFPRALRIRLDAARNIYNAALGEALRRLDLMRESRAWRAARAMPKGKERTTAKLVVVFGLPGSGKTFHLPRIKKEHDAKLIRDSFRKDSFRNLAPIMCSRHFVDLISNLREGRNCVISDIEFCKKDRRKELVEAVQLHVPDVKIVWIPFENKPEQCRKNVISSNREAERRLPRIAAYTRDYTCPSGVTPLPVGDGSIPAALPEDTEGLDL